MKKIKGLLSLLVVMIVVIPAVCGCENGSATDKAINEILGPLPEVSADSAQEALYLGNEAYKDEVFRLAEAYYLAAVDFDNEEVTIHAQNNLGLVYLQECKNRKALDIFAELTKNHPYNYGFWLNYLVAGHACNTTSVDILGKDEGPVLLSTLLEDRETSPGEYTKYLTSIIFNIIYMDMESDVPYTAHPLYKAYAEARGVDEPEFADENGKLLPMFERGAYFAELLMDLAEMDMETYGENDEDVDQLIQYLEGLIEAEESDE